MKFYVGQDVVCIKNHSRGIVMEGEVFTIKGLKRNCCNIVLDVGIEVGIYLTECACGSFYNNYGIDWISQTLFAPLDSLTDISEIEEVLRLPAFEMIK